MKLSPTRKPTRHIIDMRILENPAHHSQLANKWKILVLLEEKLMSAIAPYTNPTWKLGKTHTKWDAKISNNNTRVNKIPCCWNPWRGLIKTNQPIICLMITNNSPRGLTKHMTNNL
jgi:hypothetical protein